MAAINKRPISGLLLTTKSDFNRVAPCEGEKWVIWYLRGPSWAKKEKNRGWTLMNADFLVDALLAKATTA